MDDATERRLERGRAFLDEQAAKPKLTPARQHLPALLDLWERGLPAGEKTGWPSVDQLYTVQPGQVTVITGWPGSGKSEWLDALLVNLARKGWKHAVFSFENQPVALHLQKLAEKLSGKPFGQGPTERMSRDEVKEFTDEIDQSFSLADAADGALTAKEVLAAAQPWLDQFQESKRGLVIDPWNELEHWRPTNISETEYVSATLSLVRRWARRNNVHVWIVAHPQKIRREKNGELPIPRPDMIAGSQHWWNKADVCLAVYRDIEAEGDSPDVRLYVQKCRFKHIGRIGKAELRYSRVTGQYREIPRVVKTARLPYED